MKFLFLISLWAFSFSSMAFTCKILKPESFDLDVASSSAQCLAKGIIHGLGKDYSEITMAVDIDNNLKQRVIDGGDNAFNYNHMRIILPADFLIDEGTLTGIIASKRMLIFSTINYGEKIGSNPSITKMPINNAMFLFSVIEAK